MPAYRLAEAGIPVVTTFAPPGMPSLPTLHVTGPLPHDQMKELIRHASVYLATTPETFGIGTLEAMACGVPVLGYDWCGTTDIVRTGITGILAAPGDIASLIDHYSYAINQRPRLSEHGTQCCQSLRLA
jgi:glycosyltransferase involved in cell wall biosynthesis